MIWLYGICDRPDLPPPRRRGLAQAPLEGLCQGALHAVFTRHTRSVGEPAPDALWIHERVVERLMADRAVLPMRFGSKVDDEQALRQILNDGQQRYLTALAFVRGRVELGVRVLALGRDGAVDNGALAPVASGRDYLLTKLKVDHRASALHAPLAELAVAECRQAARGSEEILRGSYLVDRGAVGRFRGMVERLERAHPDLAILCTGPWPPYSFVQ